MTAEKLNDLTAEHFDPLVGEMVGLIFGEQRVSATVAEVARMKKHGDSHRDPFSVLFVTERAADLPQQMFQLDHPQLGRFDIFLVPLGPRGDGMCYEAVFT